TDLPVSEIAILIGFETTAAFSKAFSGFHSISPQKFRKKFLLQRDNIYTPCLDWNTVRKVRQPAQRIISFRSEGIQQFPQGYFKWLHQIDSAKKKEITLIGRSPDQPGITLPSKLRWDTAIPENSFNHTFLEDKQPLVFLDYLPAGNYLIIPFVGFGTPLAQNLPGLMKLLYQQGVQWNPSGYSFQILKKHLLQNQCVTELYIPIV
ncbi:MAG: AraC family transcriptional regulator, partial [Gillisia sp.]